MMRPLLPPNSAVSLIFAAPVELPTLTTDEGKVSQILRNLISNALKFTEVGVVRVAAEIGEEGTVTFLVSDTGIGIPSADQMRIFEEFVQLENPLQKRVKGTGLGLSLCKKMAEFLGGSIEVKSLPGVGSTFFVKLPIAYTPDTKEPVEMFAAKRDETPLLIANSCNTGEGSGSSPGPDSAAKLLIVKNKNNFSVFAERLAGRN